MADGVYFDLTVLESAGAVHEGGVSALAANKAEVFDTPFRIQRGCYVQLSGTNPQALVKVGSAASAWQYAAPVDYSSDDMGL